MAVLRLLHAVHAPIDKEDSCGDKPVRIAEIYGHQDCVQFLKMYDLQAFLFHPYTKDQISVFLFKLTGF